MLIRLPRGAGATRPNLPLQINWSSPLANNLAGMWVAGRRVDRQKGLTFLAGGSLSAMPLVGLGVKTSAAAAGGYSDGAFTHPTGPFSISAWLYQDALGANPNRVVEFFDVSALQSNNGTLTLAADGWSGTNGAFSWASTITTFTPTHVCVTYDPSATTNVPLLYVNGRDQGAPTSTTTPTGSWVVPASLVVYLNNNSSGIRGFPGIVGEVGIYNAVLTAGQVSAMYAQSTRWDLYQGSARRVFFDLVSAVGFRRLMTRP